MQAGDKVAYITSLHEDFIARNLLESPNISGPAQLPNVTFRACEPCEIEELDYYIEETSQLTVLRAKLRLLEGTGARHTSNSKNKFEIEIPPPLVGEFSEFLVELERFREQGMAVLEQGSRVKSYMIGAEGRSEWYYGNIEADKLGGTPLDSTELFTAEVVERYQVRHPAPLLFCQCITYCQYCLLCPTLCMGQCADNVSLLRLWLNGPL